jgi:hypothetical protein
LSPWSFLGHRRGRCCLIRSLVGVGRPGSPGSGRLLGSLVGSQDHDHIPPVEAWNRLGLAHAIHLIGDAVEDLLAQFGMEDLSATEHDRDLDLVTFVEEFGHLAGLGVEVAGTDLRPVLHLLDPYVDRLASRFLGSLCRIELELAVVHDSGHGWIRRWGYLDQVEIELTGNVQRLRKQLDTKLFSIGVYQAYFASADTVVDPGLIGCGGSCYSTSLPVWGHGLPVTSKKGAEPPLGLRRPSVGNRIH